MEFKKPDFSKAQENFNASLNALKSLQSVNWLSTWRKLTNAQASNDFLKFMERLPQNSGQTMLIIAGVTWAAVGALGLFTTIQVQKLTETRAKLQEAQALKPIVPVIKDVAVNPQEVSDFLTRTANIYTTLEIKGQGSSITVTAPTTAQFAAFREAISHIQSGGSGWRVNIDRLCVGRECEGKPLSASLNINKVSVDKPG